MAQKAKRLAVGSKQSYSFLVSVIVYLLIYQIHPVHTGQT